MTTLNEAREAVYDHFVTQWGTRTPYQLEGHVFSEPDPPVEWARLSVRNLAGGQETLGPVGGREYLRQARAVLQVFTPADTGFTGSDGHAHFFRSIFEGVPHATLDFLDGRTREGPSDGKYSQQIAEVDFTYYERK